MYHAPVLLQESIEALAIKPDGRYLDGTVGGGGHFRAIVAELGDGGVAVGIDRDADAIEHTRASLGTVAAHVVLAQAQYSSFDRILAENGIEGLDGALLDLGVSSHQLDTSDRGFSYLREGPLDLRMDRGRGITAAELVATYDVGALERVLRDYGEVINAPRMARVLHEAARQGRLQSTLDLRRCLEAEYGRLRPKVLSKVFQGLRIAVNRELEELETFLGKIVDALRVGGRLVVIAYHSLEDRIVKQFMRDREGRCVCPPGLPICQCGRQRTVRRLHTSAIRPSPAEVGRNPRARSARLRAAVRVVEQEL